MAQNKKIYNFNAIRPAIIVAHNDNNRKAIDRQRIADLGIDNAYFIQWQTDCNALRETVIDYVTKKKNARFDSKITEGDVYAARERIYPKWKEILHCGEADKTTRELKVSEADVEDLIGFAWDFFATSRGTAEIPVTQQMFRKKIESLLGCVIAKNAVLTDDERDTLDAYYKASKRIQQCVDQLADLKTQKKTWEDMAKDEKNASETQFLAFIGHKVKEIKEQIKACEESKSKAEETEKEYSTKAKEIEKKIALAK